MVLLSPSAFFLSSVSLSVITNEFLLCLEKMANSQLKHFSSGEGDNSVFSPLWLSVTRTAVEQDKEHTWWDGCGWACAAYDCVADREQFAEASRKEEKLLGTDGNSSHGTYNMGVILILCPPG